MFFYLILFLSFVSISDAKFEIIIPKNSTDSRIPLIDTDVWVTPRFKYIGNPDITRIEGLFIWMPKEMACGSTIFDSNLPWNGSIVFIEDGSCMIENKVSYIEKLNLGIVGVVLYNVESFFNQKNQHQSDGIPAFGLVTTKNKNPDDIIFISRMAKYKVVVTVDKDPFGGIAKWLSMSIFIILLSLINLVMAGIILTRMIIAKTLKKFPLTTVIMMIEIIANLMRVIFMIEPYPLGDGIFPYHMWSFFSTSTHSVAVCSTILIALYWNQILNSNSKEITFNQIRWKIVLMVCGIACIDSVTMIFRWLRNYLYVFDIVTAVLFLLYQAGIVVFFAYHGIKLMTLVGEGTLTQKKNYGKMIFKALVFCILIGEILFLIGISLTIQSLVWYRITTFNGVCVAFIGVNLVSFAQILILRNSALPHDESSNA